MRPTKTATLTATTFAALLLLAGCSEEQGPAEKAGEKIDETAEEVTESAEEAAEETGDAVEEAGDAVEESTE